MVCMVTLRTWVFLSGVTFSASGLGDTNMQEGSGVLTEEMALASVPNTVGRIVS